jgi:multidrug efflux pump subunit AcrB
MPSPELIQLISGLGLTGGCLIALWAFATDRVVTGKTLTRVTAEMQKRIDDAKVECQAQVNKLEGKLDLSTDQLRRQMDEQSKTIIILEAMNKQGGRTP